MVSQRFLAVAAVFACVASAVYGHGFMYSPRPRGGLRTDRNIGEDDIDPSAPKDYCVHCLNAGGTKKVAEAGPWDFYKPLESSRGGFGMCGDPVGSDAHMKSGIYKNPDSTPYVETYEPGSVVEFKFDATTNHGGYLEFYLCDVSNMPNQDISFSGFKDNCYYLERVPHADCESGNDRNCGPIDPKFKGRWVLPCRLRGGEQGDQLFGDDGRMAYRLPNIEMSMAVIQMYWLTANNCEAPDDFMKNYNYPSAWAGCPGDGGSVGGKPNHASCKSANKFPEEFWNCADVQVLRGGSSADDPPAPDADKLTSDTDNDKEVEEVVEDGNCKRAGNACTLGERCCNPDYVCAAIDGDQPKCLKKDSVEVEKKVEDEKEEKEEIVEDGKCDRNFDTCKPISEGGRRCCHPDYVCAEWNNSGLKCVPGDLIPNDEEVPGTASTGADYKHHSSQSSTDYSKGYNVAADNSGDSKHIPGQCVRGWQQCSDGDRCCHETYECSQPSGYSNKVCHPKTSCAANWNACSTDKPCCHSGYQCKNTGWGGVCVPRTHVHWHYK